MAGLGMDIQELTEIVRDISIVRYTAVATLALLSLDYLCTLEQELKYVWPSRLTVPKIIFFVNRYMPFVSTGGLVHVLIRTPLHHVEECRFRFLFFGSLVMASYLIAEFILFMRAYAIWKCSNKVLLCWIFILTCMYTFGSYWSGVFLHSSRVIDVEFFHLGCIIKFDRQVDWIAFIVLIIAETMALVLLVFKARQASRSTVIQVMFRDGLIYYVLILASTIANIIVLKSASPTLCNFLLATQGALHSMFCSRLLLNIRGVYESIDESIAILSTRSTHMVCQPGSTQSRYLGDPLTTGYSDTTTSTKDDVESR